MRVSDFHFDLPEDLIAQIPPEPRGSSRMMLLDRLTGALRDHLFRDLPDLLHSGDLLILNNSRVLPARLFATRAGSAKSASSPRPTGQIEVLLTEQIANPVGENLWRALVRPARKVQPGENLLFADPTTDARVPHSSQPHRDEWDGRRDLRADGQTPNQPLLSAEVLASGEFGERTLRFAPSPNFHATLEQIGHMPLPPYIHRDQAHTPDTSEDRGRYQTVYAAPPSSDLHRSAAAPTAGLHFTPEILADLRTRGVEIEFLTLHVGLGTFQPVRVDRLENIRLHAEPYTLPPGTAAAINAARREGRRIVAAGTTTTRTLEHCTLRAEALGQPDLEPHSGATSLFLAPGHRFRLVGGLLTNFHLPESTLLMLVSAFLAPPGQPGQGRDRALAAYAHAIQERYRFFSYGDCMLVL